MIVSNLKVITVKSYSDLYKMYLREEIGCPAGDQRMPEGIEKQKVNTKEGQTNLKLIRALLEQDTDNLYHIEEVFDIFKITFLGVSVHKVFDEVVTEYCVTFGEDGKWEEIRDGKHTINEDGYEAWGDGCSGELTVAEF